MSEVDPSIVQLADEMQDYDKQVALIKGKQAGIDAEITRLTSQRSETVRGLGYLAKKHGGAIKQWEQVTAEMHADTLYPFVLRGGYLTEHIDDYRITREDLLTKLHRDIDSFHANTEELESPAPVFAAGWRRGYVGWLLPYTSARVKDDKHLVVPIDKGLSFWSDRHNLNEINTAHAIELHSQEVCIGGLGKVLFYGDAATEQWKAWFTQTSRKRQLELWLRFKDNGADDIGWLTPSSELTHKWKEVLHKSIQTVVNGRYKNAQYNIGLAEKAVILDELQFSPEERETLEDLVAQAKERIPFANRR